MRVLIDPGHGGYDPGATGNGLREKDLTLKISRKAGDLLTAKGIEVIYTRTTDVAFGTSESSDLAERVRIANNTTAALFASVHINAGGGTGSEVYVVGLGGEAERAAKAIDPLLAAAGGWSDRGVKVSNFYVLRYTAMPAILIEAGFIDNGADATKLNDDLYLDRIALSIAKGICEWAGIKYDTPATITPTPTPVPTPTTPTTPVSTTPPTGVNITPLNGGKGWIEVAADGRVITHATNYAYLTVAPDGSVWSYGPGRDAVKLA